MLQASTLYLEEKEVDLMIPFFHDWDYRGYFGILNSSGEAIFVSDGDVNKANGSIGRAMGEYGYLTRIDHTNPYHLARMSTAC